MEDNKALNALSKIADVIFYEEGRLAIINKYGSMLDDNDKTKATELITKQRANLDQLFNVYKNELEPVIKTICSIGDEMSPLISKLNSTKVVDSPVDLSVNEEAVQVDVPVEEVVNNSDNVSAVEPDVTDNTSIETSVVDSGASVVSEAVSAEAGVVTGSEVVEIPTIVDQPVVENNIATEENRAVEEQSAIPVINTENVVDNTASISASLVSSPADENVTNVADDTLNFVLSPIDEGVAPVPTGDKKIVEGIAGIDQQLQAIDAVKQEISDNPTLTDEEKTEQLEKYTRVSEGAVRAILVTKVQYEKLMASRELQKSLRNANEDVPKVEGNESEQVILPEIVFDSAPVQETPNVQDKQKELQVMIEQANTLYKEGKTQEAQELFDKVGAMNKEIQGADSSSVGDITDTAVLVKK